MRRLALIALVFVAVAAATAPAAQDHRVTRRASTPDQVRVDVPAGWHRLHGWLSEVQYPIPALAVGSFQVQLSRHSCACGMPNVKHFPRNGAFLFAWEYSQETRRQLARNPTSVPNAIPPAGAPQRFECAGPTWELSLSRGGDGFQLELYIGPDASPATRAELITILKSLRVVRTAG
jgi:hypothetical protein